MAEYLIRISDAELECNTDECLRILIEHRIEEAKEIKALHVALDALRRED